MSISTGEKLGRYEILSRIGAGGMGEVYRAHDPRLHRDVAIKVSAEQFTERFEREAQAIAALNHPNICTLHDVGPNYLVMEYIEGTPLAGPLPLDQALRYSAQICDALEAAHRKNITHRDLKPANIMVTATGVKLLDFGLARLDTPALNDGTTQSSFRTEMGAIMGTAAYMSPEQAKGEEADARSDIFSFGAVLYELLSGHAAFARNSPIETLSATLRDEPPPLDVAPQVAAIVTHCLRKAPADRFQTIGEVRTAIEQVQNKANVKANSEKIPSIAVLPFVNMSAEKDNDYFSDGLAEEILNLLAKIPKLKVIARTSSFAFRGKEQDITQIAEALRVENILEGSVRRAGSRVRVTAQLIQAGDGSHLWSERYDRDMTDIFAIQDEIGQAISESLQLRLAPRTQVVNIEAWQHCLKGEYWRLRYTPDSLAKSKEHFERALALEPNYAHAYNGLALYYYTLVILGLLNVSESAPLAQTAARKALALDPTNRESHNIMAVMSGAFDYDWKVAEQHHRMAIAGDPVPPRARYCYAIYYLLPRGRVTEGIEQSKLALDSDPLSMLMHFGLTWSLFCAGRHQDAIEVAEKALQIDPNFYMVWATLGYVQMAAGLHQDAIASFTHGVELAPWWMNGAAGLATAHFLAGDQVKGEELLAELVKTRGHGVGTAVYYAVSGQPEAMFAALDEALRRRDVYSITLTYQPFFNPWHGDPRYHAILERMHLASHSGPQNT
jgi:serine/threonine-protein kinase